MRSALSVYFKTEWPRRGLKWGAIGKDLNCSSSLGFVKLNLFVVSAYWCQLIGDRPRTDEVLGRLYRQENDERREDARRFGTTSIPTLSWWGGRDMPPSGAPTRALLITHLHTRQVWGIIDFAYLAAKCSFFLNERVREGDRFWRDRQYGLWALVGSDRGSCDWVLFLYTRWRNSFGHTVECYRDRIMKHLADISEFLNLAVYTHKESVCN